MNLPNLISLARLISVPLVVWLLATDRWAPAFAVFLIAGLSDAVDGYLAKRLNAGSELGRYLDPIADKTLLVSVYLALGFKGIVPSWLVILVVSRDVMIVGGMLMLQLMRQPFDISPLQISKWNTAAQIALASVVLGEIGLALDLGPVVTVLLVVTAALTVLSGASYLVQWGRRLSGVGGEG